MAQSEDNTRFPPEVETELRGCGWFPGRDVSKQLKFAASKKLFPAAIDIFSEFGLMDICYDYEDCTDRGGILKINIVKSSFEILAENSIISRPTGNQILDDAIVAKHHLTDVTFLEEKLDIDCCLIGHRSSMDLLGSDYIYTTSEGHIYSANCSDIEDEADSFDIFLIKWLSDKPLDYKKKRKR